jgi:hypothetical protein
VRPLPPFKFEMLPRHVHCLGQGCEQLACRSSRLVMSGLFQSTDKVLLALYQNLTFSKMRLGLL